MSAKTLRLHIPQWQVGNLDAYHFGAQLLAWLAPAASGPVATVEVAEPDGSKLPMENGIVARSVLLHQLDSAEQILKKEAPDKVVVLGGDCLVDLVPFAYLNERYEGDLAVLWVDAHPDVMTPQQSAHALAWFWVTCWGKAIRISRRELPSRSSRSSTVSGILF